MKPAACKRRAPNFAWPARASILALLGLGLAAPAQAEGPDIHRVLVVPINLPGRAPLALDRQQIMAALYGAENSVASRYRAISYGRVQFAGTDADIVDPLALAEPPDFCNTGLKHLADAAQDRCAGEASRLRPTSTLFSSFPAMRRAGGSAWATSAAIASSRRRPQRRRWSTSSATISA